MDTFGINTVDEKKKSSVKYGLRVLILEVGVISIIVVNVIFILNYFKIIDLRMIFGN